MALSRRQFLTRLPVALGIARAAALGANRSRAERLHLGAQTNTWGAPIQDYDRLLEILETLHWLGYEGFETNYRSLATQAGRAAECRRAFESHAIRYIAPHIGAKLYDRQEAEKEIEDLRQIAGYSAEMGASHFIVSGRRAPRSGEGLDLDRVRTRIENFNRLGRICREQGLKLCYHNHSHEFEGESPEMDFLLRDLDPAVVWLNYDTGNHYGHGPDAADFSAAHFRRIAVYHLKDVVPGEKRPAGADFGTGKIDLHGVIQPLLDSDWEGWLVVEREGSYPHPAQDPRARQAQCREYLRQITGI